MIKVQSIIFRQNTQKRTTNRDSIVYRIWPKFCSPLTKPTVRGLKTQVQVDGPSNRPWLSERFLDARDYVHHLAQNFSIWPFYIFRLFESIETAWNEILRYSNDQDAFGDLVPPCQVVQFDNI